jgi:hypothetical protein
LSPEPASSVPVGAQSTGSSATASESSTAIEPACTSPRHIRAIAYIALEIPGDPHDMHTNAAAPAGGYLMPEPVPMELLAQILNQFSWPIVIILCLTLGLAPFFPEPHIWEKLKMLASGTLSKPIDIFDLLMHATPFLIAGLKLALTLYPVK